MVVFSKGLSVSEWVSQWVSDKVTYWAVGWTAKNMLYHSSIVQLNTASPLLWHVEGCDTMIHIFKWDKLIGSYSQKMFWTCWWVLLLSVCDTLIASYSPQSFQSWIYIFHSQRTTENMKYKHLSWFSLFVVVCMWRVFTSYIYIVACHDWVNHAHISSILTLWLSSTHIIPRLYILYIFSFLGRVGGDLSLYFCL